MPKNWSVVSSFGDWMCRIHHVLGAEPLPYPSLESFHGFVFVGLYREFLVLRETRFMKFCGVD